VGLVSAHWLFLIWILQLEFNRSTNNQRIERLWVDVGSQFLRRWRAFFARLEAMHGLQVDRPEHLWLLHQLFLGEINMDCAKFQIEWNHHGVSGPKTHDQTPSVSVSCTVARARVLILVSRI
jgi:hypothetical protein